MESIKNAAEYLGKEADADRLMRPSVLESIQLLVHTILYSLLFVPSRRIFVSAQERIQRMRGKILLLFLFSGVDAGRRCLSRNKHVPHS